MAESWTFPRLARLLPALMLLAAACAPTPAAAPAKPASGGAAPPAATTAPAAVPAATAAPAATTAAASAAPAASGAAASAAAPPAASGASAQSGAARAMPAPLSPPVTVKVGALASIADSGIYIGLERGYFRDLGLELQIEVVPDPNTLGTLTSTNQVDVGGTGIIANVFQAAARGVPIKMVADKGQQSVGFGYFSLLARPESDGGPRSLTDWKGRTVAKLAPCDSAEALWQRLLDRAGLTRDDITFAHMGFPDMNAALANRAVDAAFLVEPLFTLGVERGIARKLAAGDELYPDQQLAALYYSPDFAARTDAGQRFMVAYVKALRDYNDAFGPRGVGRAEIVQILAKHTTVKDLALYDKIVPAGLDPDGRVNAQSVRDDLALQARLGCFSSEVADLGRVLDESYVNYALGVLGPYQR